MFTICIKHRKVILLKEEDRRFFFGIANQFVQIFKNFWTSGDLDAALKTFMEKSIIEGIKEAGFETPKIEEILIYINKNFNTDDQNTIKEVGEKYLKIDYTYFYNLAMKIATERECNINLIDENLTEELKKFLAAPYHAMSLVGEIVTGLVKPFIGAINDPDFQANVKKAADSVPLNESNAYYQVFMKMNKVLTIISQSDDGVERAFDNFLQIFKDGGLRKIILRSVHPKYVELVETVLDAFEKKNVEIPYKAIEFLENKFTRKFTLIIANVYAYCHFDENHTVYIGFDPIFIPFELKSSSLLYELLPYISIDSFDIIKSIGNLGDKLLTILPAFEGVIQPIYPIVKPSIELIHNITTAISEDKSLEDVISSAVKNGDLIVEFVHKLLKYADDGKRIKCELVDGIKWAKNYIAQFEDFPDLGMNRPWWEIYDELGYNETLGEVFPHTSIKTPIYKLFCSFEGQGKMMEVFPFIKNLQNIFKPRPNSRSFLLTKDNETEIINYNYAVNTVFEFGNLFNINIFENVSEVLDLVVNAHVSPNGNINNIIKNVTKCDFYVIYGSVYSVIYPFTMGFDDFSPQIRYIKNAANVLDISLPSVTKAGEKYVQDISTELPSFPDESSEALPSTGISDSSLEQAETSESKDISNSGSGKPNETPDDSKSNESNASKPGVIAAIVIGVVVGVVLIVYFAFFIIRRRIKYNNFADTDTGATIVV